MDKSKNIKRILFNISKTTGKGAIYIQYTIKKEVKRFPTGIKLAPEKWDSINSKPRRGSLSTTDASTVDALYNTLVDLISKHLYQYHCLPSIQYLEDSLSKPQQSSDIHALFAEFINSKRHRLADNSISTYLYFGERLKEIDQHFKYSLSLSNFNYNFYEKLISYSQSKGISNNTINQRLDIIKAFVKYLDKKGITHTIKLNDWDKLSKDVIEMICLERHELDEILAYQPKTPREQREKDMIVLLSHTGMRVSDLRLLKREWVVDGHLVFYPQKTKTIKVSIPIAKPVMEILERTNYNPFVYCEHETNPAINHFCKLIKSLKEKVFYGGEMVAKHDILTSHSVGRKTFCNLCVQAGVPIPTLMGMTGHSTMNILLKSYLDKHQNKLPQLQKVFEF